MQQKVTMPPENEPHSEASTAECWRDEREDGDGTNHVHDLVYDHEDIEEANRLDAALRRQHSS